MAGTLVLPPPFSLAPYALILQFMLKKILYVDQTLFTSDALLHP